MIKITEQDLKFLLLSLSIFIALIVTANVVSFKLVNLFGLIFPAGVFAYAFTFTITDVVSELYGKKHASLFVYAGFVAELFYVLFVVLVWRLPALQQQMQSIFSKVFTISFRIIIASLVAFLISQSHDVIAYEFWGRKTKGKWLWLRNNLSTMVSQLIDTIIFITIAFYGVIPLETLINLIFSQYIVKIAIALLDTPIVYIAVAYLSKKLNRKSVFTQP